MPSPPPTQLIPSLNGLRAIAVLIVFVGHSASTAADTGASWPGHTGVTIFFFLSGYLITTLLRREHETTHRISLPRFYLRRALRILPPAYLAIATSIVLTNAGMLPNTHGITPTGVIAELLNVTNYYLIVVGRSGLPPETSMLWSLAVEEHFYLLFPAALLLLYRRRLTRTSIGYLLLAACALAPLYRVALHLTGASFLHLYTGTDTRFDSILFGAALALLANPALGDRLPLRPAALTGVAPVAALIFIASTQVPATFFRLTLADTIQCLCLVPIFWLVISRPDGRVGRILNSRALAHLGVLSFSIYLFHRMVLALVAPLGAAAPISDLIALVLTIAVAQLVYVTLERPLARLRRRLEAPRPASRRPKPR
jgi:peptidoglycan/LPS O-acetylase OafA/YrhL